LQAELSWDFQGPDNLNVHDQIQSSWRFIASDPGT
jgi:hypothetical protein